MTYRKSSIAVAVLSAGLLAAALWGAEAQVQAGNSLASVLGKRVADIEHFRWMAHLSFAIAVAVAMLGVLTAALQTLNSDNARGRRPWLDVAPR
jgi:hypothetical protein